MSNRQCLKKEILLCGRSNGEVFKRTFYVVKKLSEGASSICYEAYHENSGRGVLKEFYPKDAYALERTSDGQLINPKGLLDAHNRFIKAEKEYIEPYKMLLDVKKYSDNQDVATFIPAFEIYHGCDENGNIIGSTYIWTPDPKLETFDYICNEIHKKPGLNPEHKLVIVLTAMESLVKCMCVLHSAGMIHRDIKPSNFGFVKRGDETLTQTLSMFDIDTMCSVYGKTRETVGTAGYLEPEAGYEIATNQTDIFSIGATLFHAIIVTDEVKNGDYLYKAEYYNRLHELVEKSKLICASEANSHPRLRNTLAIILEKCLCERTYRYANCEELLIDLEKALYYALPSDIAQKNRSGEKWVLADVEKSLDVNKGKNSFLAIQYHLYEYPLYQYNKSEDENINILVIGFGSYGQKFLDACLQNGQIRNKKLQITVVTDDLVDKELYLSNRPELPSFFNIDGSLKDSENMYGNIVFESVKLEREDQIAISDVIENLIQENPNPDASPQYVFIALGEDMLNYAAAKACKKVFDSQNINCAVSYVCEDIKNIRRTQSDIYPLYINQDIKKARYHKDIERMAFNTHLMWEKNLNLDEKTIRAEFKKKYNHDSCVSSVLALKSKLYSVGIDLDAMDVNEAARQFNALIKGDSRLKDELIWIEHRRWVAEKLCQGWQRFDTLEDCVNGLTRDEKRKRHICIAQSRPDQKLSKELTVNGNYEKWDCASKEDLDALDELDRISVELHRLLKRKSIDAKQQDLLSGPSIESIRELIEGEKQAIGAFQEWFSCLKDIYNGEKDKVRLYEGLKTSFLNTTSNLSYEKSKAIREQVRAFETLFYPVLASEEYRDWKQIDAVFIDNIPFVLTYSAKAYLAIPYSTASTELFDNVSALTIVNPEKVLYLLLIQKEDDIKALSDSFSIISEYLKKKHLKATIDFILICQGVPGKWVKSEVERRMSYSRVNSFHLIKVLEIDEQGAIPKIVFPYLKKRASGKEFFALENNETTLSSIMQSFGSDLVFNNYSFDSKNMVFDSNISECEMLKQIKKAPRITVSDIMLLQDTYTGKESGSEFYSTYELLWEKYNENKQVWYCVNKLLWEYANKNDILLSLKKMTSQEKRKHACEYRYILPYSCYRCVANILHYLIEQGVLEKGTKVQSYTSDSCEIVIIDRCNYKSKYDTLFSNIYPLMMPMDVKMDFDSNDRLITIRFNDLLIHSVFIPETKHKEVINLMSFLENHGLINHLMISRDGKMSFTFATRQVKELLIKSGRIVNIYLYHKLKDLGAFDDIVCNYEIIEEKTGAKTVIDLIITKGFRTLFVVFKACPNIEQDYYKLSIMKNIFGFNAQEVQIDGIQERVFYENMPECLTQYLRGEMIHPLAISSPEAK